MFLLKHGYIKTFLLKMAFKITQQLQQQTAKKGAILFNSVNYYNLLFKL